MTLVVGIFSNLPNAAVNARAKVGRRGPVAVAAVPHRLTDAELQKRARVVLRRTQPAHHAATGAAVVPSLCVC